MTKMYRIFGYVSIVLLAALCGATAPAQAQNALYTIEGVTVDVTAESAAAARDQAFAKAEQDAFMMLAQRLLPESAISSFTPPDTDTISNMVQDFEITNERLSPVRYMGTYTFRFRDEDVQSFFRVRGAAYTTVASRPMLVLPFYQWGSRMVLWEGANPWLDAWGRARYQGSLVPVTVPIGDAQDVSDIADNQALTYAPENLEAMLMRYDAGDALIAIATPVWPDDVHNASADMMPREIAVMLYRSGLRGPDFMTSLKVAPQDGDTLASLYERAAQESRKALQTDWKTRTAAAPQEVNSSLQARVRISSMGDWVNMQRALNSVQGVENIKLIRLSPQEARIELQYRGSESRLRLALEQSGIVLSAPSFAYASNGHYSGGSQDAQVYDLHLNNPRIMQP